MYIVLYAAVLRAEMCVYAFGDKRRDTIFKPENLKSNFYQPLKYLSNKTKDNSTNALEAYV